MFRGNSETNRDKTKDFQEDLLIHGDSVYDVIDKQDHMVVQNQLSRNSPIPSDRRLFLCRINVSRNSRRQLRFGDQKVIKNCRLTSRHHPLFAHHSLLITAGNSRGGSLFAVRSRMQSQRVCFPGIVHPGGSAGDAREHRPGRDEYLHHDSLDGHEVPAHR